MPVGVTPEGLRVRAANRIRVLLVRRGMSVAALARTTGVDRKHLTAILSGRSSPTLDVVARIAIGLDIDPVEILRPVR